MADSEPPVEAYPAQLTNSLGCRWTYALLQICGHGGKIQLSLESLASVVRRALSECHGCVGGAIPFDALLFQESTGIAVLRMHKRDSTAVLSSLAVVTEVHDIPCQLIMLSQSASFAALSSRIATSIMHQ